MARQTQTGTGARQKRRTAKTDRQQLADMAKGHAEDALAALVEIAREGGSETARISAANAILDRAYGKPSTASQTAADIEPLPSSVNLGELSDEELVAIAQGGPMLAKGTSETA
ncbi:hypothetical protein FPY71_11620 [Aureimonas fodinaquatilis]|uniref:Uncharacterized protein n=1 Tax=Aureimonas fodinaquatilis TaxID=2565783 RepID=A0A5B0DW80_9HYPH|nr:hypothetical protein [Aureimonas fodinaquatilis]KAA0971087.1 hypothetical protein FPY71_11620 [Aureimonas fodinaquatilis]